MTPDETIKNIRIVCPKCEYESYANISLEIQQAKRQTIAECELSLSNFAKTLDFATGGRMSKTNYTWEAIREELQNDRDEDCEKARRSVAQAIFDEIETSNCLHGCGGAQFMFRKIKKKFLGQDNTQGTRTAVNGQSGASRPDIIHKRDI